MSIIEEFIELTKGTDAPTIYRKWTILCTIAAVLNRNVWTSIRSGMPLFPNLYTLLVGPPGTGKGMALRPAKALLSTQSHINILPDSASYENIIHLLANAASSDQHKVSSGVLFLEEWGTFMRKPENDFCAMMANIYDCGDYIHHVLSRPKDAATNVYPNICSCCTPEWFAEGFPPNSYGQGLPTRFQFIYAEQEKDSGIADFDFGKVGVSPLDDPMTSRLFPALCTLSMLRGFVGWDPEAAELFNEWKDKSFAPVPTDPMLYGYNQRRHLHVAKLAVIYAVSRHPAYLSITTVDLNLAMETLFEAEVDMPRALKLAGGNPYSARMEAVAEFVKKKTEISKSPVPEWQVRQHLSTLVPPNLIHSIITELISAKRLKVVGAEKEPMRRLLPGVKQ
jgi:hypothetical protein